MSSTLTIMRMGEIISELKKELTEAKEIIREYVRLSLQEDKDMIANIELFKRAEEFLRKYYCIKQEENNKEYTHLCPKKEPPYWDLKTGEFDLQNEEVEK